MWEHEGVDKTNLKQKCVDYGLHRRTRTYKIVKSKKKWKWINKQAFNQQ